MSELAFAVQHVHRNEDHAKSNAGEIQVDEVDAVRQVNTQAIAASDASRAELVRHTRRARVDFAECERAIRSGSVDVLEADAIRATAEREVEQLSEMHVRGGAALSYDSLSGAASQ